MKRMMWIAQLIGLALVLVLAVTCSAPQATPTLTTAPPIPTVPSPPTPVPPTTAPTLVPPTSMPPTDTPTTPANTPAPRHTSTPPIWAPGPNQPTIESIKITSQALAGNLLGDPAVRPVNVVLPPSYATSNKRYPVVYVLAWGDGDITQNTLGFYGDMQQLLVGAGAVKEMILVLPDGTNKLGSSQWRSSPTIGDYRTYVAEDVVDWVDAHYRTLPTRDSRGLAGCSNGGTGTMNVGFKFPGVFSVLAATGGDYMSDLKYFPSAVQWVQTQRELPKEVTDLGTDYGWDFQAAAGTASDPANPPFYFDMPIRIVNGHGEYVPEVHAKIENDDPAHAAQRYMQQPIRLRAILIRQGLNDEIEPTPMVRDFDKLLTGLGIEHQYVEVATDHCGGDWEQAELKFMSDKLVFEGQ